jgi:membrane-associated phospholipid phosphatase
LIPITSRRDDPIADADTVCYDRRVRRRPLALSLAVLLAAPWTARADPDRFHVDPILDGAVIGASASVGLLLELIIRTGELQPQAPGDPARLLGVDRGTALSTEPEAGASLLSNVGVGVLGAWALTDIALGPLADRGDGVASFVLYAESAAMTLALTNVVKIAVRRPRPRAYQAAAMNLPLDDTDSALSFYSGHTAMSASLAATATYLSFAREDPAWLSWTVLGGGAGLTALVGWNRVRSRAHFFTDVVAGGLAGAAVGLIVPHLHRVSPELVRVARLGAWADGEGGGLTVSGAF